MLIPPIRRSYHTLKVTKRKEEIAIKENKDNFDTWLDVFNKKASACVWVIVVSAITSLITVLLATR